MTLGLELAVVELFSCGFKSNGSSYLLWMSFLFVCFCFWGGGGLGGLLFLVLFLGLFVFVGFFANSDFPQNMSKQSAACCAHLAA